MASSARPHTRSAMSFSSNRSSKSHRSGGSVGKIDLTETAKDKLHLNTKADPTVAVNEAQPSAIALEASNLGSLRSFQHKDTKGNLITDPDRSNPTRHRMERPLDTIRSFEDAIDGSYSRRMSSFGRPESRGNTEYGDKPRRPAYGNGNGNGVPPSPQGRGYSDGGYYTNGNRNSMNRPDSFVDQYANQYSGQAYPYQGNNRGPAPRPNGRNNSDPMLHWGKPPQGVYPSHSYQQSYDTMNSGGSYQTDQWGNSTDPSSQNSSFDRIHQYQKPNEPQQQQPQQTMGEDYGIGSFGDTQQYSLNGYNPSGPSGMNRFEPVPESGPAPPPKHSIPRVPIKLDDPNPPAPLPKDGPKEKRRSSFFRRFSKS